jgi:ATP-dependent Lon protease
MKRITVDKTSKKRTHCDEDLDDFIVDDSEDEDYVDNLHKKKVKLDANLAKKLQSIEDEIDKRDIAEEDILKLNLSLDDNIWFIEHIRMMDSIKDDTDEKYNLKQKIYNRYRHVISPSYHILKTTYGLDTNQDENMINKIFSSNHPDRIKYLMFTKFNRASEKGSPEEYFKVAEWIDYVLNIPTEVKMDLKSISTTNITEKLGKFWDSVNKRVYGLTSVKEKLLEALNTYLMSGGEVGRVITLIGPPGVGKTSIAAALADAMDLPFEQISMQDIADPSVLIGHSSTYIGSHPGIIVEILRKNRRLDNLILLDEIDKTRNSGSDGQNLSTVLLKIMDKVQNKRFNDAYMPEIDIDLSKIIFVATANIDTECNIPRAVLDRSYKIYIDGYSDDDKVEIGNKYIIPKILNKMKLDKHSVSIDNSVLKYLISKLEKTSGVRNLEKALEELIDRLLLMTNLKFLKIPLSYSVSNVKFPIKVTKQHIDNLVTTVN